MIKKIVVLFIILTLLTSIGCERKNVLVTQNGSKTSALFCIENYSSDLKKHKYLYYEHPKRIVALWQNSVETLIALGAGDRIIAVGGIAEEKYLHPNHLEAYRKILVRSRQVFSQEEMLLLRPDFILGWLFDFTGKNRSVGTTAFWEKRNINIHMNLMNGAEYKDEHVLEDEIKYIRDVGKIVDEEENAKKKIKEIYSVISECKAKIRCKRKPRVLIVANLAKNISVYTPRTLPGDIVSKLGGIVIGKEKEAIGEDEFMSIEEVRLSNPDIIFISTVPDQYETMKNKLAKIPSLSNLRCVKEGKVFCIPYYTIRSPGVRIIDALKIFSQGIQRGVQNE